MIKVCTFCLKVTARYYDWQCWSNCCEECYLRLVTGTRDEALQVATNAEWVLRNHGAADGTRETLQ